MSDSDPVDYLAGLNETIGKMKNNPFEYVCYVDELMLCSDGTSLALPSG